MKIYKPSELHAFLNAHGISAKKRFSQNFLIDYNILKKIATCADIQQRDCVFEIGAGPGALTEILLEKNANVLAIEVDPQFAELLGRLQNAQNTLEIVQATSSSSPWKASVKRKQSHTKKSKSSLIYPITSLPLFSHGFSPSLPGSNRSL